MTVTASQVFSFLEQHPTCLLERREIHQGIFSILRRNIRVIVIRLKEDGDDESQEIADRLRRLLSEWLTVPVSFDDALLESVSSLGDGEAVERRWGREIRTAYDHACASARLLQRVRILPAPECAMPWVTSRLSAPPGGSTATGEPALYSNPSSQMIRSLQKCSSIPSRTTGKPRRLTC